eukprot:m.467708 g.467708  ORF g.467708 m.467708 type:complete len:360 (-) comp21642_c1_seq14:4121-5200(-)
MSSGKDVYSFARVRPLKLRSTIPMYLGLHSLENGNAAEALSSEFPSLVPGKSEKEDVVTGKRKRKRTEKALQQLPKEAPSLHQHELCEHYRCILKEAVSVLHFQTECLWRKMLDDLRQSMRRGLHGLLRSMSTPTNLYRIVEIDGVTKGQLTSFFPSASSETCTAMRKSVDRQFERCRRTLYYSTYRDWVENFPDMDYTISKAGTNSVIVCPCALATESYLVKDSVLSGLGLESPLFDLSVEHSIATSGAIADAHSAKRVLLLLLDKQIFATRIFFLVIVCGSPTSPQRGEDRYSVGGVSFWGKCGWVPFHVMQIRSLPHVSYVDSSHVTNTMSVPQKMRVMFRPLLVTGAGHVLDFST